jgi:hypothetical protein
VHGAASPAAIGGEPGHDDSREVGKNGEETVGDRFRPSPWSGTARGGGSTAAGGCGNDSPGGGAAELGRESGIWPGSLWWCGERCRALFIGAGRWYPGRERACEARAYCGNGGTGS